MSQLSLGLNALFSLSILCFVTISEAFTQELLPTKVAVQIDQPVGRLQPIWRFFGADEPNYAYMKDGKRLLGDLGDLRKNQVFFRTHNLLTTGPAAPALKWGSTNAYTEDKDGNPVYDWKIVDLIFDTYLQNGIKPYVQIGFMPKALSIKPEPYEHTWRPGLPYDQIYTGWAYPPKDYDRWMELVYQWTKHCIERYGVNEVQSWYWQTWNEPNIGYWKGSREEFFKTHDYAIAGVLKALPTAKVGGPDTAGDGGNFSRAVWNLSSKTSREAGRWIVPAISVIFIALVLRLVRTTILVTVGTKTPASPTSIVNTTISSISVNALRL